MGNLIVILLLAVAIGILMFNDRSAPGYTADQNAQLAAAYKNKADAFEGLNAALKREVAAQAALLNAYRRHLGLPEQAED